MANRIWASELARRVGVSQSTIVNWTSSSIHQPPLAFQTEKGHRTFSIDDYERFAQAHPDLRGIARQGTESDAEEDNAIEQLRGELQQVLAEIEATIEGSEQAGRSARRLRRRLSSLMARLP